MGDDKTARESGQSKASTAKAAKTAEDAPARPDPPLLAEAERRAADGIVLNLEEE